MAIAHAEVKPNPYSWGSRNHPMTRSHMRAYGCQSVKKLGAGVSSHMCRQGSSCSLGIFWGNFNGGPSHRPFWGTREKRQVTCGSIFIDFVSSFFFFFFQGWRPCFIFFKLFFRHCLLHLREIFFGGCFNQHILLWNLQKRMRWWA